MGLSDPSMWCAYMCQYLLFKEVTNHRTGMTHEHIKYMIEYLQQDKKIDSDFIIKYVCGLQEPAFAEIK